MGEDNLSFNLSPPGFRFYPSDEELVVHFLHRNKSAILPNCHPDVIPDLHLYPCDPWDLNGVKTNWMMHEYSSVSCSSSTGRSTSSRKRNSKFDYSRWVICRVYENNGDVDDDGTELSCLDEIYMSLDDLDEISFPN
ncbi:hypothetical protein ABFX02_14G096600 [Erythranthe guttata]